MRSDEIILNRSTDISLILDEAEAAAAYRRLEEKPALRLRLLAEELISMLPNLLDMYSGKFWIENEDKCFELHVELDVTDPFKMDKDRIMELSKSGKNIAYAGVMGKIRYAVEMMLNSPYCDPLMVNTPYFYSLGLNANSAADYYCEWSLQSYQSAVSSDKDNCPEEWDELEKSIICKLADDVIVGVCNNKADIIIKKTF